MSVQEQTFTLPPKPYPAEARWVEGIIMDFRGRLYRKKSKRFSQKLTPEERNQIARGSEPAWEVAEDYGISEQYVRLLRRRAA